MFLPNHGANPKQFVQALGLQSNEDALDFSVNTNPLGFPGAIKKNWLSYLHLIEEYPDPHGYDLKATIARKEQISINQILLGNGAAELIYLLAQTFRGQRVMIVEPSFSEYRDAAMAQHCRLSYFQLTAEAGWKLSVSELSKEFASVDVVFICHPNNPTGVVYDDHAWAELLSHAERLNTTVVVDEAFYDFCSAPISVLQHVHQFKNLVVLRSLTKMYSIPGIRLGYLAANEQLVKRLAKLQHPWNINGLAQVIGKVCLESASHVEETVSFVSAERNRLLSRCGELGFETSPSQVNFFLLKEPNLEDAMPLITYLIEREIIPRHTYNFRGLDGAYVRLAVKGEEANNKLLHALESWKQR
ncbi:threonine-phosphate decarboxylase CobD [Desertibacillus haloalkaliphilus]|uniref:threonine-phosphate decarboxylase CobD n=1 Tax=Desertibacillus haloalkaliphilus TaxID=1328930 RepID=UPI001C26E26A|nr:threonine-phosphate decarboxylase CobD [Desertibacillus haloalkaliphilus]MBU8907184.1 threonine-phosphate decarboxylase CobD [Desertibacillus haloalkaliphilus]